MQSIKIFCKRRNIGAEREEGDVVVAEKHKADGEKGSAVQVDQQGPSVSSE